MIDNRPIIPAGSRLALTETSEKVIVMWNVDSDGYRHHAMYRHKDLKPVVCRDFFKSVPNESPPTSWRWYHSRELAEQNHQENSRHFGSAGHAECQKVLLCGGGPSAAGMKTEIETARSLGYHVIVLSRSAATVRGDTFIGIEPRPGTLQEVIMEGVHAHFLSIAHPDQVRRPWDRISFGRLGHMPGPSGMPVYHPHENVGCIALEYIFKVLKARKLIMVAMEHPPRGNYFYHGIEAQAMCWHASRHGVEVWNCTENTSVIAGVLLGDIQDALTTDEA